VTPSVRDTARKVERILAVLEARERNLARAVAIVRNLKAISRKYDTMPDLVNRR
jgi:DNA repair ATPase RecN